MTGPRAPINLHMCRGHLQTKKTLIEALQLLIPELLSKTKK